MLQVQKKLFSANEFASFGNLSFFRILLVAIFPLLVIYLNGCATTKLVPPAKPSGPAKGGEAGTVRQVEDLNPEALPDSIFVVQERPTAPEVENPNNPAAEQSTEETAKETVTEQPGYRVQIAALSNQDEAMQIKKEAMLKFADQGVYLIFDPPFYKIRVGDFVSRYDAEKLQQQAIQLGYKDAWIVRTRVKVRKME